MSSHVPNLNTLDALRRLRSGPRKGGTPNQSTNEEEHKDTIVQQTDQDASVSRLSAVELGYLSDPFATLLSEEEPQRRLPIINRGTFVRTSAIDLLVDKFLAERPEQKKQIISLGAGSDTRFFRLAARTSSLSLVYHELDFSANTSRKIASIRRSDALLSLIQSRHADPSDVEISEDGTWLYSPTYNLHPIDLRTLTPPRADSNDPPLLRNADPSLPTLLLSECCLIYLPPANADAILQYFTSHLFPPSTPLGIILYEPINPDDSFGRVMVQNLARRGIVLQTLKRYATLGRQRERLRLMGFGAGQGSADVDFIYENWIAGADKERVARLEMLDEVEEWRMLAQHYCVAWAWRDGSLEGMQGLFDPWRNEVMAQPTDD